MRVGKICTKETITVGPEENVARAASAMRENHVGAVVVERDGRPLGIVTDRDIALRCGGRLESISDMKASEIMTPSPLTALETEDVLEVLDRMRERGVRRMPVVNDGGYLAGMLTLDDILVHLARSMRHVAEVVLTGIGHEG